MSTDFHSTFIDSFKLSNSDSPIFCISSTVRFHAWLGMYGKEFVHNWCSVIALLPATIGTRTDAGLGVVNFGT